jgi:hypothetical protein
MDYSGAPGAAGGCGDCRHGLAPDPRSIQRTNQQGDSMASTTFVRTPALLGLCLAAALLTACSNLNRPATAGGSGATTGSGSSMGASGSGGAGSASSLPSSSSTAPATAGGGGAGTSSGDSSGTTGGPGSSSTGR